jgi:DNA-directed RNA polymerase subunit alpha
MAAANGFPMPQGIEIDEATATAIYAKFTAAPFQTGFGHTLGNSLRRVLLSSLEGAAISSVRIDGVPHEYSSIDGVIEDVVEIILNLKKIRLNLHSDQCKTLEIRADKKGPVTGADIITDGTVEVLNPEQVICNLDKAMPFRAEIEIAKGKGYVPAEKNKSLNQPLGMIPVDCLFSPVTRVNYHVGDARIGDETEMDKLTLEIWTDGRIAPEEALESAATILKEHLRPFLGTQIDEEDVMSQMDEDDMRMYKILSQDVEVLDLSVRAMNCLNNAGIRLIYELSTKTESRMLKYRNFGRKSLDEIKEKLEALGEELSLGLSFNENLIAALDAELERVNNAEKEEE